MVGLMASFDKTLVVDGEFCDKMVDGHLYIHPDTRRLYMYTKKTTRSCPDTAFFPVYDGVKCYETQFSNAKYESDMISADVGKLANTVTPEVAGRVYYQYRRSENNVILKPAIRDGDNMFTQCVKGVICAKDLTIVDLYDMCNPKLPEKTIDNYYTSLNKITFMRLDKWKIWITNILHVSYKLTVYDEDKKLISYFYPEDKYDTGIISYEGVVPKGTDPFKTIVRVLMTMRAITKSTLKSDEVDDFNVNNLMTTINSDKPLSAQLFSRFIRLAGLSFTMLIYDGAKLLFTFNQGR